MNPDLLSRPVIVLRSSQLRDKLPKRTFLDTGGAGQATIEPDPRLRTGSPLRRSSHFLAT